MELETVFLSRQKNHTFSLAYELVRYLVLVAWSQQFHPLHHVAIGQSAGKIKIIKRKKFSIMVFTFQWVSLIIYHIGKLWFLIRLWHFCALQKPDSLHIYAFY
jgi:hypothetical protein